jgi:uncharacterized membrane protein YfcA
VNPLLILAGFAVGALVGLTSAGGGSLMTPLLVYLGLDPMIAVGTDLLYSLPTKTLGWYLHRRQGTLRLDIAKYLCVGGVPAALVGLAILTIASRYLNVHQLQEWVKHAIGVMVVISAAMIAVSPLILRRHREISHSSDPVRRGPLIAIGAGVGFIVSLTSIGSGAVALPLLVLFVPGVTLAELVGSDIAFSTILVLVAAAGQWRMGHVDVAVTLNLLVGSMAGVYLGSRLCGILSQQWVRPALAVVLAVAGSRLLI